MQRSDQMRFLRVVLVVVLANYLAQIPYYLHLYYLPHKALPSLFGSLALVLTLAWFLAGYLLVVRGSRSGYWILLAFHLVEFLFYLENELVQVTHFYDCPGEVGPSLCFSHGTVSGASPCATSEEARERP